MGVGRLIPSDLDGTPDGLLEFAAKWLGALHPVPIRRSQKDLVRKVASLAILDVLERRRSAATLTEPEAGT